jgi:hypothetical protein
MAIEYIKLGNGNYKQLKGNEKDSNFLLSFLLLMIKNKNLKLKHINKLKAGLKICQL